MASTKTYNNKKVTTADKGREPVHNSDHPDAVYIKQDEIGQVLSQGMAVLYLTRPKDPVDYLAKWLLNYSQTELIMGRRCEQVERIKELREKHEKEEVLNYKTNDPKVQELILKEKLMRDFNEKVDSSFDLNDQL